jgi:hypothetical protein
MEEPRPVRRLSNSDQSHAERGLRQWRPPFRGSRDAVLQSLELNRDLAADDVRARERNCPGFT